MLSFKCKLSYVIAYLRNETHLIAVTSSFLMRLFLCSIVCNQHFFCGSGILGTMDAVIIIHADVVHVVSVIPAPLF